MVNAKKQPLVLFFILAYAISWILWLPLVLSRRGLGALPVDLPTGAILLGGFGPCLAAYLTNRWCCGNWQAVDFFRGWRRAWIGMLVAPFLLLVGQVVIPALVLTKTSVADLHWKALLNYPFAVVYWGTLLTSPLGEEPGWRGYALPKLQCMMGPFRATMVLGLLWALWHLPLFLIKGWTNTPVPVFVMIGIARATIITCAFNWSGGSVIVAIIAHSAVNARGHVLVNLLAGAPTREGVSVVHVMALSLLTLAVLLTAFTRGRLGMVETKNGTKAAPDVSAQHAA